MHIFLNLSIFRKLSLWSLWAIGSLWAIQPHLQGLSTKKRVNMKNLCQNILT